MNQKLSNWASIAEIVSAAAVVISLIFVGLQIRQNTQVTKSSAYQSLLVQFNDWREEVSSDDSKLQLYNDYILSGDVPEESTPERMKLNSILLNLWANMENAFTAYDAGLMDGDEWERVQRSVCIEYERMLAANINEYIYIRLTDEFVAFVKETC